MRGHRSNARNRSREEISRRRMLGGFVGGAVASSLSAAAYAAPAGSRRPNFLVVLSDDHGLRDTGCYGNQVVRTPNMDRLASQGLRFTRAFTATAMCTPSRSQLYTGLFPHRNGAHPNHSAVRAGTRSLPHYLRPLGYRVGLAGKRHIRPAACFPFEYLRYPQAEAFVRRARDAGAPFCLIVALHEPHAPWLRQGPHEPARVPIFPNLVDTPETRQAMAHYYNSVTAGDAKLGQYMAMVERLGLDQSTLLIYASDHGSGFPFCKWTCYEAGLNVPFIARWPGHIRAGATTDAMVSFVDVLATFLEAAGGQPQRQLDGRSFLAVLEARTQGHRDLVYGTHTTQGIISGSFYPIRSVRDATRKYIVNLNPTGAFTNVITEGRRARPARGRQAGGPAAYWLSWQRRAETDPDVARRVRFYQHRPAEEFYDLTRDPFELHNLARDPAQRQAMDRLRRQLIAWMRQQNDPMLPRMT